MGRKDVLNIRVLWVIVKLRLGAVWGRGLGIELEISGVPQVLLGWG